VTGITPVLIPPGRDPIENAIAALAGPASEQLAGNRLPAWAYEADHEHARQAIDQARRLGRDYTMEHALAAAAELVEAQRDAIGDVARSLVLQLTARPGCARLDGRELLQLLR
jgi:hypothetical protein